MINLTRIGIDVQAELHMKTGSPTLGFPHHHANVPHIPAPLPPLQRTAIQRHQARKSGQNFLPRLAPGHSSHSSQDTTTQSSSRGHPTPSSHASSPNSISTRSPMVMQQGGSTPPNSAVLAQPQQQHFHTFSRIPQQSPNQALYHSQQMSPGAQRGVQRAAPPSHRHNMSAVSDQAGSSRHGLPQPQGVNVGGSPGTGGPDRYYPSPFQKDLDGLGKFFPVCLTELCSS